MTTVNNEPQIHMDEVDFSEDGDLVQMVEDWKKGEAAKLRYKTDYDQYKKGLDRQKEARERMAEYLKDYQGKTVRCNGVVIKPGHREGGMVEFERKSRNTATVKAVE